MIFSSVTFFKSFFYIYLRDWEYRMHAGANERQRVPDAPEPAAVKSWWFCRSQWTIHEFRTVHDASEDIVFVEQLSSYKAS